MKLLSLTLLFICTLQGLVAQSYQWNQAGYSKITTVESNNIMAIYGTNSIRKLDQQGNILASYNLNNAGTTIVEIAGNANGSFGVVGTFVSQDFNLGAGVNTVNMINGGQNWFYAVYDVNGAMLSLNTFYRANGANVYLQVTDAVLSTSNQLTVLGHAQGSISFYFNGTILQGTYTTNNSDIFYCTSSAACGILNINADQLSTSVDIDNQGTIGISFKYFGSINNITSSSNITNNTYTFFTSTPGDMILTMNYQGIILDDLSPSTTNLISSFADIKFGTNNTIYFCGNSNIGGAYTNAFGTPSILENNGSVDLVWGVVSMQTAQGLTFPYGFLFLDNMGNSLDNSTDYYFSEIILSGSFVYISALLNDPITFNNAASQITVPAYGAVDAYITKIVYNVGAGTADYLSSISVGGLDTDVFLDFEITANGNYFVHAQSTAFAMDLDPSPVTFNVPSGNYLVKYNGLSNSISGLVYNDANGNGIQEIGENGQAGIAVTINDGTSTFYVTTNSNGEYVANTSIGNYTLSIDYSNNPSFSGVSPNSIAVNASQPNTNYGQNDFGLMSISGVENLSVFILPTTDVSPGFPAIYSIVVQNNSTQVMNPQVTMNHTSSFILTNTTVPPTSQSPGILDWNIPTMNPGAQLSILVTFLVPANTTLGTLLYQNVSVTPLASDIYPFDNTDDIYQVVTGSYDPNDKQVFPPSVSPTFVQNGEYLNYLVRFQNTGTDTAFTVIIRDTLDIYLTSQSLEIIQASHAMVPTMYYDAISGRQVMEFKFDQILLPDSTTNEAESHGFIAYRVKLDPLFTLGDVAYNTADIYFDFNTPIITNTTNTAISPISANPGASNVNCYGTCDGSVYVQPLGGTAPYVYNWLDTNESTDYLGPFGSLCPGVYTSMITDAVGNVTFTEITVTQPDTLELYASVQDCSTLATSDGTITLTGTGGTLPYTYSIDGGINYVTNDLFTNLPVGTYTTCIMDALFCMSCTNAVIDAPASLTDVSNSIDVSVYPNPSEQTITIEIKGSDVPQQFQIMDIHQRLVMKGVLNSVATQVDISKLSSGFYFLKIGSQVLEIIKM